MTADAPQPGETPRSQGNPWDLADPDTPWWRGETEREAPQATPPVEGSRLITAGELVPEEENADRNRPTVVLTPRLPTAASSPHAEAQAEARLERVENSTFWLSEEERAALAAAQPDHPPGRRRKPPDPNPAGALFALVTLSLVAAFFSWVSAEPFWLAVGHGDRGYATTTHCRGDGLTQRCTGRFAASDGRFSVSPVTLLGVSGEGRRTGAVSPARMVSPDSDQAYAAPAGLLMHLRWTLGFLLVLICGYGITEVTKARRLGSRRAVAVGFAGPLLLLAGFLTAAY